MSVSGSDSTRRSVSGDTASGKRIADDDDERSNLSDRTKRLRRDGSRMQLDEDDTQDSIVVSLRPDLGIHDTQSQTGRTTPSPQPSSSLSSPLSSAPSRLAEDCGEMAQKAMEAWQNATDTKSDANRQESVPGRRSTNETRTVVSPRSPGSPTRNGSTQPRDWLTATDERHHRTPLPTKKESRSPESASARLEESPARGGDSALPTQHLTLQNGAQSSNRGSDNSLNTNSGANQQSSNNSDDHLRTLGKTRIQLSVRDVPRWHAGAETRQLPPLPSLAMGFSSLGRNNMPQQPVPHSPSLASFPSSFSALTSNETQRHQNSNRGGKRCGRKPDARGHVEERPVSQGLGSGHFQQESTSRQEVRSDDGQARSSPEFRDVISQQNIRRPVSAAGTMPHIHHSVQSKDFVVPSPHGSPGSFRPPPVIFTIDNRAESPLQTAEAQSYIENFTQYTAIILPNKAPDKDPKSYPISIIMWQGLHELYKWYTQLLHLQEIGPLMFELVDVHWQEERSFVVPEGNLSYFRTMKQYVWDLYWTAVHVNKGPSLFRVRVTRFTPQAPRSPSVKPDSQWSSSNSKFSRSPGRRSGADQQNHIIVESRPGPLFPHQQPPVRPPVSTPVTIPRPFASHDGPLASTSHHPRPQRDSFTSIQPQKNDSSSPRLSVAGDSPQRGHARTLRDQAMLRERAISYLGGRQDLEILDHESTVLDKLPYKTGAEVCGVVVDKKSGKGMVAITGKGYITQNVKTGLDEPGDRYQEIKIQPKQTCMLHGEAVVLFYRRRQAVDPASQLKSRSDSQGTSQSSTASEVEIIVRLQIDGNGRYSPGFGKSVLRPKISTIEFFSFFANQSGHCAPAGPPYLKFTFKDAMPSPKSTQIERGNEDHFNYMRKDIKTQCEKAKEFMGDLKEFVILVTVPGWTTTTGDDEEDW